MDVPNTDLITLLMNVGLNVNQALVYLAVLELGPSAVADIAKKSGLKRPTCYLLLEELEAQGYATRITDSKHTMYSVIPPKQLLQLVEQRYRHFANTVDQLEALAKQSPNKPIIRFFEGEAGLIEAYLFALDHAKGDELLIYGSPYLDLHFPTARATGLARHHDKNISLSLLWPDSDITLPPLEDDLTAYRFLPSAAFNPVIEVIIAGDVVTHIAPSQTYPYATAIENLTLAKEEKQRFNLLWGIASE
jgi:HTH-type transcriptional regulator, sugar sensing transcriptional regulator